MTVWDSCGCRSAAQRNPHPAVRLWPWRSQPFVELLDVAHGVAGVPDRRPFDLIRDCLPLRVQEFELGHHRLCDALPDCRLTRTQYLNRQVVAPAAGVQPGLHELLLLCRGIDPYFPRLLSGSAGVRASGS